MGWEGSFPGFLVFDGPPHRCAPHRNQGSGPPVGRTQAGRTAAEEHLHLALDIHGLDRKRTRAIVLADLGHVQLKRGNSETALATWREFLDCADGVQSVRINDGLTNIAVRLTSMPDSPAAAELGERIAARA